MTPMNGSRLVAASLILSLTLSTPAFGLRAGLEEKVEHEIGAALGEPTLGPDFRLTNRLEAARLRAYHFYSPVGLYAIIWTPANAPRTMTIPLGAAGSEIRESARQALPTLRQLRRSAKQPLTRTALVHEIWARAERGKSTAPLVAALAFADHHHHFDETGVLNNLSRLIQDIRTHLLVLTAQVAPRRAGAEEGIRLLTPRDGVSAEEALALMRPRLVGQNEKVRVRYVKPLYGAEFAGFVGFQRKGFTLEPETDAAKVDGLLGTTTGRSGLASEPADIAEALVKLQQVDLRTPDSFTCTRFRVYDGEYPRSYQPDFPFEESRAGMRFVLIDPVLDPAVRPILGAVVALSTAAGPRQSAVPTVRQLEDQLERGAYRRLRSVVDPLAHAIEPTRLQRLYGSDVDRATVYLSAMYDPADDRAGVEEAAAPALTTETFDTLMTSAVGLHDFLFQPVTLSQGPGVADGRSLVLGAKLAQPAGTSDRVEVLVGLRPPGGQIEPIGPSIKSSALADRMRHYRMRLTLRDTVKKTSWRELSGGYAVFLLQGLGLRPPFQGPAEPTLVQIEIEAIDPDVTPIIPAASELSRPAEVAAEPQAIATDLVDRFRLVSDQVQNSARVLSGLLTALQSGDRDANRRKEEGVVAELLRLNHETLTAQGAWRLLAIAESWLRQSEPAQTQAGAEEAAAGHPSDEYLSIVNNWVDRLWRETVYKGRPLLYTVRIERGPPPAGRLTFPLGDFSEVVRESGVGPNGLDVTVIYVEPARTIGKFVERVVAGVRLMEAAEFNLLAKRLTHTGDYEDQLAAALDEEFPSLQAVDSLARVRAVESTSPLRHTRAGIEEAAPTIEECVPVISRWTRETWERVVYGDRLPSDGFFVQVAAGPRPQNATKFYELADGLVAVPEPGTPPTLRLYVDRGPGLIEFIRGVVTGMRLIEERIHVDPTTRLLVPDREPALTLELAQALDRMFELGLAAQLQPPAVSPIMPVIEELVPAAFENHPLGPYLKALSEALNAWLATQGWTSDKGLAHTFVAKFGSPADYDDPSSYGYALLKLALRASRGTNGGGMLHTFYIVPALTSIDAVAREIAQAVTRERQDIDQNRDPMLREQREAELRQALRAVTVPAAAGAEEQAVPDDLADLGREPVPFDQLAPRIADAVTRLIQGFEADVPSIAVWVHQFRPTRTGGDVMSKKEWQGLSAMQRTLLIEAWLKNIGVTSARGASWQVSAALDRRPVDPRPGQYSALSLTIEPVPAAGMEEWGGPAVMERPTGEMTVRTAEAMVRSGLVGDLRPSTQVHVISQGVLRSCETLLGFQQVLDRFHGRLILDRDGDIEHLIQKLRAGGSTDIQYWSMDDEWETLTDTLDVEAMAHVHWRPFLGWTFTKLIRPLLEAVGFPETTIGKIERNWSQFMPALDVLASAA